MHKMHPIITKQRLKLSLRFRSESHYSYHLGYVFCLRKVDKENVQLVYTQTNKQTHMVKDMDLVFTNMKIFALKTLKSSTQLIQWLLFTLKIRKSIILLSVYHDAK